MAPRPAAKASSSAQQRTRPMRAGTKKQRHLLSQLRLSAPVLPDQPRSEEMHILSLLGERQPNNLG
ncbi:MAG: hypothetical protein ABGU97_00440 [Xylella fastidiosa subsp. multiplex]|uniref:Uncharacterized protein n=1 Tax=Xylella fastidiosa subsp. fastidiosa TaxID=644356 RepID=A0AAJ5QZX1_XYLFS|nr:hypothetical protein [Xylella fastidiosa]WCF27720.1 hypothetical protein OK117_08740 [Xylella fastidiosa subsp. fastidiosa]